MEIEQLLVQSLQLLGLGMGSVFIILTLLILIVTLVSKLVPEEIVTPSGKQAQAAGNDHIAAIQAAIHQYRKKGK